MSFENETKAASQPTLFVIMPFRVRDADLETYGRDAKHWDEVYEGLIVPAGESAGFRVVRDDDDKRSRFITENICLKIEQADVVLCDLSSENPNVYFEMGWAMRADKKYVLIKDELTKFNFDLNQASTLTYSHRLQPSHLRTEIISLADAISATHEDSEKLYSLARKLQIDVQTLKAAQEGGDAAMLGEILREIRVIRSERLEVWKRPKGMVRRRANNEFLSPFLHIEGSLWDGTFGHGSDFLVHFDHSGVARVAMFQHEVGRHGDFEYGTVEFDERTRNDEYRVNWENGDVWIFRRTNSLVAMVCDALPKTGMASTGQLRFIGYQDPEDA